MHSAISALRSDFGPFKRRTNEVGMKTWENTLCSHA
jgi:hypothetical protein